VTTTAGAPNYVILILHHLSTQHAARANSRWRVVEASELEREAASRHDAVGDDGPWLCHSSRECNAFSASTKFCVGRPFFEVYFRAFFHAFLFLLIQF
jgi:hypothetical protein